MADDNGATAEIETIEPSFDDTIRETFRELQAQNNPEPEIKDAPVGSPESIEEKADRVRDNGGKFAKETPVIDEPVAAVAEPAAAEWAAPNAWKKDAAEKLRNADPAIREEVARREADFHRGIDQYKEAATFGHAMNKAIEPFMQTINSFGISPDQAVTELMQADHRLRNGSDQERTAFLVKLAGDYGIDVKGLASYEAPYVDPSVAALQQQVSQFQQYFDNQQQSSARSQQDSLNSEIQAFSSDPKHSHFDSVKDHMAALLQAGLAQDLPSAYEQAVYANPAVRGLVLAEQQAQQRAELAKKATAAKVAASVNHRQRTPLPSAAPVGTMDDTIRGFLRGIDN
jgi:hypothetical protein